MTVERTGENSWCWDRQSPVFQQACGDTKGGDSRPNDVAEAYTGQHIGRKGDRTP